MPKYFIADCADGEIFEGNKAKLYADLKAAHPELNDADIDNMFANSNEDDPINFTHCGKYYDTWIDEDF